MKKHDIVLQNNIKCMHRTTLAYLQPNKCQFYQFSETFCHFLPETVHVLQVDDQVCFFEQEKIFIVQLYDNDYTCTKSLHFQVILKMKS